MDFEKMDIGQRLILVARLAAEQHQRAASTTICTRRTTEIGGAGLTWVTDDPAQSPPSMAARDANIARGRRACFSSSMPTAA